MNLFNLRGAGLMAVLLLIAGCDGSDQLLDDHGSEQIRAVDIQEDALPKAYNVGNILVYNSATVSNGSGDWTIAFTNSPTFGGVTSFNYSLTVPGEASGTFSYVVPECATYADGSASPAPSSFDGTTLEWDAGQFAGGVNNLSVGFEVQPGESNVPAGVVSVGVDGDAGSVIGPCAGRIELKGTVFINDTSEEGGTTNDDKDPEEPGVGNVEVAVQEWNGESWVFDDSPRQLTGNSEGTYGQYSFLVLGLSAPDLPSRYRVVVPKTATLPEGINSTLFQGLIEVACDDDCPDEEADLIAKEQDFDNPEDLDFGFEVNVEAAIAKFESGEAKSDGQPREYWATQFRQRPNSDYGIDFSRSELLDFVNCFDTSYDPPGPIECIFDPNGNPNDFSGDVDALLDQVLPFNGRGDYFKARLILKRLWFTSWFDRFEGEGDDDSLGDIRSLAEDQTWIVDDPEFLALQLELRQELFVSLLNYTDGRGVCIGELDANDRCLEWDEGATRIIIENAIVTLVNSEFKAFLGKASSGKVRSNTDLLSGMNN